MAMHVVARFIFVSALTVFCPIKAMCEESWATKIVSGSSLTEIADIIGRSVSHVEAGLQRYLDQRKSESVGNLVKDLSKLAGIEDALAERLEQIASEPNIGKGNAYVFEDLNSKIKEIQLRFHDVRGDIDDLDPTWAQMNPTVQIDIGNFAHDGAVYYCIKSCDSPAYKGQIAIDVTQPDQAKVLITALRKDVAKIRSIGQKLDHVAINAAANKL